MSIFSPFHQHMRNLEHRPNTGVFKKAVPARPQPLGRAERTEEYVSTAKWRERGWRHFSTLLSRTMLPSRPLIVWWVLALILWATTVGSVQETPEVGKTDSYENQPVEDDLAAAVPSEETTLLEQLQARLKEVEARERGLQQREERLTALQQDLEALAARQTKEGKRLVGEASSLADEQRRYVEQDPALIHLIKIYESMDPEEAALRIAQMREGLALDILASIKDKKAAGVLAGVEPVKAARLSEGLRRYRDIKLQQRTDSQTKK